MRRIENFLKEEKSMNETTIVPGKKPVIVQWLLVAGLAIVTNLFVLQIERVVFDEPQYEAFCPVPQVSRVVETEAECLSSGGRWNENIPQKNIEPVVSGYCEENFTCNKQFEEAHKVYERDSFVVSVIAGVVILAFAAFLPALAGVVGNGLSFGAILLLIVSSTTYWTYMEEWLRLIVLAVAFVSLIGIAVKKFGDRN